MSKRILNNAKKYFESIFEVNYTDNLTTASVICNTITLPAVTDEPIDLYVYVKPENDNTKQYFAAASSCVRSANDDRPISGIYYLNFNGMSSG